MVIEESPSYRKVWAIKRDINKNTIDVLMTPHAGLYQCFIPNHTIVAKYHFDNVFEFNLFYGLMQRLMEYRVYVDFASKEKGNKQLHKLVQPKIDSFIKLLNVKPDVAIKNPDLPDITIDFNAQQYKPEIDRETPVFAYKQQSDENGKWIYTLALKKYKLATIKDYYPVSFKPETCGDYFTLASIYIAGFSHDDKQYDEYSDLVRERYQDFCPSNYILDKNRDRIQRFQNYFTKTK